MSAQPPQDESRYEAILAGRREATFFHTRAWAQIVTTAFPQLEDRSAVWEWDGEGYAVPLFRWHRLGGLLSTLHSGFPFLYGGPIPARPEAFAHLLQSLAHGTGALVMLGNPFAGPMAGLGEAHETTHLLSLPRSVEEYWERVLTTRKRNDIRRLTQKGVAVELSRDEADVERVYALYRQRMTSWSQRPGLIYPPGFYRAMLNLGHEAVRLYVARYQGRLIGGAFVTRWNRIVHYNAGYFDDQARALRPNVLIQERVIRDAITDGFHTYDMLPSAGLAPVEAFKESFGGVRTLFPRWERLGPLHRLARRLRRRPAAPREVESDER